MVLCGAKEASGAVKKKSHFGPHRARRSVGGGSRAQCGGCLEVRGSEIFTKAVTGHTISLWRHAGTVCHHPRRSAGANNWSGAKITQKFPHSANEVRELARRRCAFCLKVEKNFARIPIASFE